MSVYIVGSSICGRCGAVGVRVARIDAMKLRQAVGRMACDICGHRAMGVETWHPAELWPEVEQLVKFDDALCTMRLPSLEKDLMQ